MLLHRFEQSSLRLRRSSVDLIRENHVSKKRSLDKTKSAMTRLGIHLQHVRARDIGRHEIGGKLDPFILKIQRLRDCRHKKRLRKPGNSHQKGVASAKHRHENLLHHLLLPHNDLGQLVLHPLVALMQFLHCCFIVTHWFF